MCKELAKLYNSKEDARAVATRAMLNTSEIPFSDKSIDTWKNIIIYAIENNQLLPLVETCQKEHNTSVVLLEAINNFYKQEMGVTESLETTIPDEKELLGQLLDHLEASFVGFKAQIYNRNELYERVRTRLKIEEPIPYEDFFATHYDQMNLFEKRLHKVIRNYTEYIKANNELSNRIVVQLKHLDKKIPQFSKLRRHLDFWLHKYQSLFVSDPAMCLVYTGVGEKLPFLKGSRWNYNITLINSDQFRMRYEIVIPQIPMIKPK